MTKVQMHRCDFCDRVEEAMNEGVVRLTDNVNEVRFEMCDSCVSERLGQLGTKPRRGRAAQAEAAVA